jgi:hypothetical protein
MKEGAQIHTYETLYCSLGFPAVANSYYINPISSQQPLKTSYRLSFCNLFLRIFSANEFQKCFKSKMYFYQIVLLGKNLIASVVLSKSF